MPIVSMAPHGRRVSLALMVALCASCSRGESRGGAPVGVGVGDAGAIEPEQAGPSRAAAGPVTPSRPGVQPAATQDPPRDAAVQAAHVLGATAPTLSAWMKANASPAIVAGDFEALAQALDETARFAPAGYPNWASISRDGASAARVEDLDAVKAACRSCHSQYKDKYRRELHDRPI